MDVLEFSGEYRFLSNFWPARVLLGEFTYPTVEHAYQAAKTLDPQERADIMYAPTPATAKRLGKSVTLRKDWEDVKLDVMDNLVRQKFKDYPELLDQLCKIDGQIVEGNWWNDTFWGVCKGKGRNELGKILMRIRDEYTRAPLPVQANRDD